ncbi:MAG: hypothetical protein RR225_09470 [Clostridium sp.]
MKEKLQKFMMGRYGVDELNRFLMGLAMIVMVLDLFVRARFLYVGAVLCLFFCYARMLSKKINQRFRENQKFLTYEFWVKERFQKGKAPFAERKKYHIYRCPNCKQKIRVPRGKGKISIHCPKCKQDFIKNS